MKKNKKITSSLENLFVIVEFPFFSKKNKIFQIIILMLWPNPIWAHLTIIWGSSVKAPMRLWLSRMIVYTSLNYELTHFMNRQK